MKILGISGSVRQGSYNLGALRAAQELLPENTSLNIGEIKDIPLFSEEANRGGLPPEVVRFREQIAEADAILFATPEYIFSVSARLKNPLEWAYIPPQPSRSSVSRVQLWEQLLASSAACVGNISCARSALG